MPIRPPPPFLSCPSSLAAAAEAVSSSPSLLLLLLPTLQLAELDAAGSDAGIYMMHQTVQFFTLSKTGVVCHPI